LGADFRFPPPKKNSWFLTFNLQTRCFYLVKDFFASKIIKPVWKKGPPKNFPAWFFWDGGSKSVLKRNTNLKKYGLNFLWLTIVHFLIYFFGGGISTKCFFTHKKHAKKYKISKAFQLWVGGWGKRFWQKKSFIPKEQGKKQVSKKTCLLCWGGIGKIQTMSKQNILFFSFVDCLLLRIDREIPLPLRGPGPP